jgi:hypothetical protein
MVWPWGRRSRDDDIVQRCQALVPLALAESIQLDVMLYELSIANNVGYEGDDRCRFILAMSGIGYGMESAKLELPSLGGKAPAELVPLLATVTNSLRAASQERRITMWNRFSTQDCVDALANYFKWSTCAQSSNLKAVELVGTWSWDNIADCFAHSSDGFARKAISLIGSTWVRMFTTYWATDEDVQELQAQSKNSPR